jgi:ribose transport system permease protein
MLGMLYAIIFGVVVGIANAALLPWLGVSSLVTTVGSMMFLTGIGYWIAGGRVLSYANLDVSDFLDQNIAAIFSPRSLITIACFVVVSLFLRYTTLGRDIYASGGHRKAAIQSGARVGKALTVGFVISGGLSALGGGLLSLSLATASATMGSNILLQAASAAIVGGVALGGGIGSPLGVAMGVLILTVLNNGLGLLSATSTQILLVNGLLLLIVVLLDGRLGAVLASPLERFARRKATTAA